MKARNKKKQAGGNIEASVQAFGAPGVEVSSMGTKQTMMKLKNISIE